MNDPFGNHPPIQLHIARPVDQTWTIGGDSIEDSNIRTGSTAACWASKLNTIGPPCRASTAVKLNVLIALGSLPETVPGRRSSNSWRCDQLEDPTAVYERFASGRTKKLQLGEWRCWPPINGKLLAIPIVNAPTDGSQSAA